MIRKFPFWLHLVAGLLAAIPIGFVSLSGAYLAFEPQVDAWREAGYLEVVPGPDAARPGLDALVLSARSVLPGRATAITVHADNRSSAEVQIGRDNQVWVDPWTGRVRGHSGLIEKSFGFARQIHTHLALRGVGGAVIGVAALLYLVLSVTGPILWWPRNPRAMKRVIWPRKGLRGRARDWQWHNSIGILVLPFLFLFASTGTVVAWDWAENALYAVVGSPPPPRESAPPARSGPLLGANQGNNWQAWLDTALLRAPAGWATATVHAPSRGTGAFIQFRLPDQSIHAAAVVRLSPEGRFESFSPSRNDLGTRLRSLAIPVHTGRRFGIVGESVMFAAALAISLLAFTGAALSWRRFRPRIRPSL